MNINHLSQLTEEQLDEVRMSPTSLKQFANSKEAEGIKAGFEAEVIFRGRGGSGESEAEADYDMDTRARSIDDVIEFFRGGDYGISRGQADRLRDQMYESYHSWAYEKAFEDFDDNAEEKIKEYIEENDEFDYDEAVREALEEMGLEDDDIDDAMAAGQEARKFTSVDQKKELARENSLYEKYLEAQRVAESALQEFVDDELNNRGRIYDSTREQFVEENLDEYTEDEWFENTGDNYMSDVANEYNLDWPYITYDEYGGGGNEYNEDEAESLASDFKATFRDQFPEMRVKTGGYHSQRPQGEWENTWYFEDDGSLEAEDGDMPCEIVSPPMPLETTLAFLPEFWAWVKNENGYTNTSTGFHMSVSLPNKGSKEYYNPPLAGRSSKSKTYDIDLVKLIMFLGDKHLLEQFDRIGNTYCAQALPKLQNIIENDPSKAQKAMDLMKNNLIELAGTTLKQGDFGKYTSINPKTNYVEFRIAGGDDYEEDIQKLQTTLMRYAYAMHIAGDNNLYRDEYAKKLVKALSPSTFTSHNEPGKRQQRLDKADNLTETFVLYSLGMIPKDEVKARLRQAQVGREVERSGDNSKLYWWRVQARGYHTSVELVAANKQEAIEKGKRELGMTAMGDQQMIANPIRHYTAADEKAEQDRQKAIAARAELDREHDVTPNESSDKWNIVTANGDVVHTFERSNGTPINREDASRLAAQWIQDSQEYLQDRQIYGTLSITPAQSSSARPAARREWTGNWNVFDAATGEILYTFGGVGNNQGDANRVARNWLVSQGTPVREIEVYPEMAPVNG